MKKLIMINSICMIFNALHADRRSANDTPGYKRAKGRIIDTDVGPVKFQLYDRNQRYAGEADVIEVFLPYYARTNDQNRRSWNFKIKQLPAGADYIRWEMGKPFKKIIFKQDLKKHSKDPIIAQMDLNTVTEVSPILNEEKIYVHDIIGETSLPEGKFFLKARAINRKTDRRMPEKFKQ